MDGRRPTPIAGKWLRSVRLRLGLSTRDVQEMSRKIATAKENHEYYLSHNWISDIEMDKFTPGMFKLYSLSAIYHKRFSEVASKFGLQIGDLNRDSASIGLPRTHLLDGSDDPEAERVALPIEFKPGFRFGKTNLLARVVEKWMKYLSACCSTSIFGSPCMGMSGSKISRCFRSFVLDRLYRLMRRRGKSARLLGKTSMNDRSTLPSSEKGMCAVGARLIEGNSL